MESDIGYIAYLQKENSQLKDELIKIHQALDVALDKLDTVRQYYRGTALIYPDDIAEYCNNAIDQIKRIAETKEVK